MIAQALNSSEFRMMMDAFALPKFMRRALGGDLCEDNRAQWDQACKDYYEAMGSPSYLSWMDVLIPFGISFDNAPVHKAYRKAALRPRVTLHEEFRTLFEHAVTGLNFDIAAVLHSIFRDARERYLLKEARARTELTKDAARQLTTMAESMRLMSPIDFYVKAQFRQFTDAAAKTVANEVIQVFTTEFEKARKTYRNAHDGIDWCSLFRRNQAFCDWRWMVFLPEQFMPLGNTTPDLHQTAEMLVGRYKADMRRWTIGKHPESRDLKYASSYDEVLQQACARRNQLNKDGVYEDKESISKSIRRMWVTCQIVAAEHGERFTPTSFPTGDEALPQEVGTGGKFPPKDKS